MLRRATIRDVAREAQVSVASVSRALNGLPSVTKETRARIRTVADRLGYVPHAGARSLSLSRTNVIGVVLPDLHGEFFSELVRGMDRATAARGYQMLFSTMHADTDLARQAMMAMHGRVDGLIVMAPQLPADLVAALVTRAIPVVLINSPEASGHDQLRLDNFAGIEALVRHLLDAGARRIVHIAGPVGNLDADERRAAFRNSLATFAPGMPACSITGNFRDDGGFDDVARQLVADETHDAVLAANDVMALGAMRALKEAGRDEVLIAGFDDIPLSRHLGLTTVRVPLDEIGDEAVDTLIGRLRGDAAPLLDRRIVPQLVIRRSTERRARDR